MQKIDIYSLSIMTEALYTVGFAISSSEAYDLFAFPMVKNVNAQRQLIPQYGDIDFSHIQ